MCKFLSPIGMQLCQAVPLQRKHDSPEIESLKALGLPDNCTHVWVQFTASPNSCDLKSVLNSWNYIEYAWNPVNITRVLQDSTLCFSACAMNSSQTPAARGILCLNLKCIWSMSGKQNLWTGYLLATIRINGSLIPRPSLPSTEHMNTSQTPAVRGILCLNLKCIWSMSGKQNLWTGYLQQYGSMVASYPGLLSPALNTWVKHQQ